MYSIWVIEDLLVERSLFCEVGGRVGQSRSNIGLYLFLFEERWVFRKDDLERFSSGIEQKLWWQS